MALLVVLVGFLLLLVALAPIGAWLEREIDRRERERAEWLDWRMR